MSDRETPDQETSPTAESREEMRPLPDGGLGANMPAWLRKPPAWRNLPRPEGDRDPASKELPEPDTSVIDPRTLVDVDDLPTWLQEIAARSGDDAHRPDAEEVRDDVVAETPQADSLTEHPTVDAGTTTVELTAGESAPATPSRTTPMWIWAMRGAIILSLLLVIFYVFFL